mmetsp:Transcript_22898/g.54299  ORF Transcript_22898/g.54299 Transcript_22898/m.54299 type:complete len:147 (-) Transcript_22898:1498-1938(-)
MTVTAWTSPGPPSTGADAAIKTLKSTAAACAGGDALFAAAAAEACVVVEDCIIIVVVVVVVVDGIRVWRDKERKGETKKEKESKKKKQLLENLIVNRTSVCLCECGVSVRCGNKVNTRTSSRQRKNNNTEKKREGKFGCGGFQKGG